MNSPLERQRYIESLLEEQGIIQVNDLAAALSVSEMTIRRDLAVLEQSGVARRTHGGAERLAGRSYEPAFEFRSHDWKAEKTAIAHEALAFISEGDTIAIDSGTSAMEFGRMLLKFRDLTIVTPSLRIAALYLTHPTIKVFLSGGELRKNEGSLVGEYSRHVFENLFFDTFFLSSAGISSRAGLTEYSPQDAAIKRLIVEQSRLTVALMVSKKFEKICVARVCAIKDIHTVITDKSPPETLANALKNSGVNLTIAEPRGDAEAARN